MKTILAIAALILVDCYGSSRIEGDAESDGTDTLTDAIIDIPVEWECTIDSDCDDGDRCTQDRCRTTTRSCEHEAWTGFGILDHDVQVTHTDAYAGLGAMTWTGSVLGLAWSDGRDAGCLDMEGPIHCNREVYFKIVDPTGVELSVDARLSDSEPSGMPETAVWTGSEYAVGWMENLLGLGDLYIAFTTVASTGVPSSPEIVPSAGHGGRDVRLSWTGSEFAMAWSQGETLIDPDIEMALHLTRFGPDGEELADMLLPGEGTACICWYPALAWSGSEMGIAYRGDDGIVFQRLSTSGEPVGGATYLASREAGEVLLMAWTGSEYGVSWQAGGSGTSWDRRTVSFARFAATGEIDEEPVTLSDPDLSSLPVDLVWAGSEFGLTWRSESGAGMNAYLTRLDPLGTRLREDLSLSSASLLEWTGSEYLLGWSDDRDGVWRVYMNRAGFCE